MQQWLDRFCRKHPRLTLPGLMRYIVIGNVLVYLLDFFGTNGYPIASSLLGFSADAIAHGQIWRIVTFIFVPLSGQNPVVFALSLYLYYFIGNALEREWGSNKFTIFYFFGVVLNILVGFLVGGASMHYVNLSMFFAFATLYPDLQFLLFFIIPVKAKWLAWFDAAFFALSVLRYLFQGHLLLALIPVVAIFNYLLFFATDISDQVSYWRTRAAQKRKQHTDGLLAVPAIEFHLAETLKIRQKPFLTERRRRRLLWVQYRPCQNLPALFPDKINPHIFPRLVLIRRILHHLLWTD